MKLRQVFKQMFWSGCKSYDKQLRKKVQRLTDDERKKIQDTIKKNQEIIANLNGILEANKDLKIYPDENIQYNIYESGPTLKKYVKHMNRIHRTWKHRFFYPVFFVGKKILGKYIVKSLPNSPQYKNLKIFDIAMEKTFRDWITYVVLMKDKGTDVTIKDVEKGMKSGTIKIIRTLKELVLTVAKNDTAYIEMMSILMFNIAVEMNKRHEKHPKHIVYSSSQITDPVYFHAVWSQAKNQIHVQKIFDPAENTAAKVTAVEMKNGIKIAEAKPKL